MLVTGNKLKELRKNLGLSVDEFAKALDVHRSSIYRYEGNNPAESRELPMSLAIRISEKFNISLDWLAGNSENKYRDRTANTLTELYESLNDEAKKELFNYAMYLKNRSDTK